MTTHTPLRCNFSNMSLQSATSNHVVLLNSGSYPSYSNYLNQTWVFTGTDWTNLGIAGPTPRVDGVMAFDGNNVMLYGGRGPTSQNGPLGDTWTFNGTVWTQQSPSTSPFPRYKAEAAYLSLAGAVVMFGGQSSGTYANMLEETWLWNGTTWSQATPTTSPSARAGHAMAASASQAIVFGGRSTNSFLNDTWSFDGTQWTQLFPTTVPSVRGEAMMVWDSSNALWVMFGGENNYNYLPETWTFDGTNWTQRAIGFGPSGKIGHMMAFDITTHKTILFGGNNETTNYPSNETWSFDGAAFTWTKL